MNSGENVEGAAGSAVVEKDILTPEERRYEAIHTIKNHTITAMGVGILPVPGLDLVALTGVQLNLLRKLGALYGFRLSDEAGKKLLASLLSGYLPLAFAAPAASILKFIPGIGIAAGVLAQSTLAGATTYAVGKLFLEHFESGGNFLNFRTTSQKLRQKIAEGKEFVKQQAQGRTVGMPVNPSVSMPVSTPTEKTSAGKA
jgi:uncharacterized protein (DUF697 family)